MKVIEGRGQVIPLTDAARLILEECRMVLPGIQALFGFQLLAVFSAGFGIELTDVERRLHLVALVLVAFSVALLMTPAAYHRQTGLERLTHRFLALSARLLLASMPPLALGVCLDTYILARVVLGSVAGALGVAVSLFVTIAWLWFVLPRWTALRTLFVRAPATETGVRGN